MYIGRHTADNLRRLIMVLGAGFTVCLPPTFLLYTGRTVVKACVKLLLVSSVRFIWAHSSAS